MGKTKKNMEEEIEEAMASDESEDVAPVGSEAEEEEEEAVCEDDEEGEDEEPTPVVEKKKKKEKSFKRGNSSTIIMSDSCDETKKKKKKNKNKDSGSDVAEKKKNKKQEEKTIKTSNGELKKKIIKRSPGRTREPPRPYKKISNDKLLACIRDGKERIETTDLNLHTYIVRLKRYEAELKHRGGAASIGGDDDDDLCNIRTIKGFTDDMNEDD